MSLLWFRNPPSIIGRMPKQQHRIMEILDNFFNWIKSTAPFTVYDLEIISPDYLVGYIREGNNTFYFTVLVSLKTSVAKVKIEVDFNTKEKLGLKKYNVASFIHQCNINPILFREDYSSLDIFREGYEPLFVKTWESVKIPQKG